MTQVAEYSQLNAQQKEFVRGIIKGLTPESAAEAAGYSTPKQDGWRLRNLPHVRAAIHNGIWTEIQTVDAPAARQVLREIMHDPEASKAVRVECAKTLLNRGGFVEPKAQPSTADGLEKSPNEMTGDELRTAIGRLDREMALRLVNAKTIEGDVVPADTGQPSQALDILD